MLLAVAEVEEDVAAIVFPDVLAAVLFVFTLLAGFEATSRNDVGFGAPKI